MKTVDKDKVYDMNRNCPGKIKKKNYYVNNIVSCNMCLGVESESDRSTCALGTSSITKIYNKRKLLAKNFMRVLM